MPRWCYGNLSVGVEYEPIRPFLLYAGEESTDHSGPAGVSQLVKHEFLQVRVHIEDPLDIHVGLESLLDAVAVGVDALDVGAFVLVRADHHGCRFT